MRYDSMAKKKEAITKTTIVNMGARKCMIDFLTECQQQPSHAREREIEGDRKRMGRERKKTIQTDE